MSNNFNPKAVWKAIYDRLVITAEDVEIIKKKRGLSEKTIEMFGLKSSGVQNKELLKDLDKYFPPGELENMGVFKSYAGEYQVASQLCGYGMTSEKDVNGNPIWRNGVNPILIPYLDAGGNPFHIRPHKGGLRKPLDVDDLDVTYTGQHAFSPFLLRTVTTMPLYEERRGFVVLTEGEWKALALIECGIPAIAFPGIQAIRNNAFKINFIKILRTFNIEEVTICFDNELKDNQPDPYKRYDASVYAHYTKAILRQNGFNCKVVTLPDEWRVNKKADWDGALVKFISESKSHAQGIQKARKEFLKVLNSEEENFSQLKFLNSEREVVIQSKLAWLFHTRQLPIGDDSIKLLARRLQKRNPSLANAFRKCFDRYFTRKPPRREQAEVYYKSMEQAKKDENWLALAEAEQLLLGMPKHISNFTIRCHYTLINTQGEKEYLVTFHDATNNTSSGFHRINNKSLSTPSDFRKFCLSIGFTYKSGDNDLANLTEDMQAQCQFRNIHEIPMYGYCEDIKLWKFGDRAYTPDGKEILPDSNHVFWYQGIGYQTDFGKRLGEGFSQGAPQLGEHNMDEAIDAFLLMSEHIHDALGGYDGWLAIGTIAAYAAHPEILKKYGGAPGLWLTGRKGGGKSTIGEWLTKIFGYSGKKVVLTETTTANFVARELSKNGCLPCVLDEFRQDRTRVAIQDIIKNSFNRSADGKATSDATNRTRTVTPQTTPVILGESSTADAATRSRFINLTIIENKSINNPTIRLQKMNENAHLFPKIGSSLMVHRSVYVETIMRELEYWGNNNQIIDKIPQQRERFVVGTAYCAFVTLCDLLYFCAPEEKKEALKQIALRSRHEFLHHALSFGEESQKEIASTTFASEFWGEIITLLRMRNLSRHYFYLRYAKIDQNKMVVDMQEVEPHELGYRPVLYMAYNEAYTQYKTELRKSGELFKLSIADLQREFKNEPFWIKNHPQKSHRIRNSATSMRYTCWCLDLTLHPYGEDFIEILSEPIPTA